MSEAPDLNLEDVIADQIGTLEPPEPKFCPKFTAFDRFILVQAVEELDSDLKKSKGGVWLPPSNNNQSEEDLWEVVVVDVSSQMFNENTGTYNDVRVKVSDHVWISTNHKYRNPQTWGDQEARIIQESDIVGHLTKSEYDKQKAVWDAI